MIESKGPTKSVVIRGVAASPGIGIGKAFLLKEEALSYIFRALAREEVKREIQRFRVAITKTRTDILATREKVLKVLGKSHAALIDVHLLILEDALFTKDVEKKIAQELMNAEAALVAVLDHVGRTFDQLGDEYFRQRKDDIVDVGKHVMRHLLGRGTVQLSQLTERSIVIAHDLAPSETISLRDDLVEGFATDIGGRTSHTAILAQGLEIPAVVGLKDITAHVKTGDLADRGRQRGVDYHQSLDDNAGELPESPGNPARRNPRAGKTARSAGADSGWAACCPGREC